MGHHQDLLSLQDRIDTLSRYQAVSKRFQKIEDRTLSHENRLQEHSSRHATQFNQLWTKTQGLSNTVESVRLKDRALHGPSGGQGVGADHNLTQFEELEHEQTPVSAGPSISEV